MTYQIPIVLNNMIKSKKVYGPRTMNIFLYFHLVNTFYLCAHKTRFLQSGTYIPGTRENHSRFNFHAIKISEYTSKDGNPMPKIVVVAASIADIPASDDAILFFD